MDNPEKLITLVTQDRARKQTSHKKHKITQNTKKMRNANLTKLGVNGVWEVIGHLCEHYLFKVSFVSFAIQL